jgi:hypothetical protein
LAILSGVFLVLLTAWMFLGWRIGESRDIRWMRNWCAGIFVITSALICLGGGAVVARRMTQTSHRASVERFSRLLHERASEGRLDDVRDAIHYLAEQPAECSSYSPDILTRVDEVTEALQKTSRTQTAARPHRLQ